MSLIDRRRALIEKASKDPNPIYTSSKGKQYRKFHTMVFNKNTISSVLNSYGTMDSLEELTITGSIRGVNGYMLQNGQFNWNTYAPNLKKLYIIPTIVYKSGSSTETASYISFGHYAFSGLPNLEYLQLGALKDDGYCCFSGAGYFKTGDIAPTKMTLVAYRTSYHAKGGFNNGNLPSGTTLIQYDWTTGEVLYA